MTVITEFRLQCTKTDEIWPFVYDTEHGAKCAQANWNSDRPVRKMAVGQPPVRVVEVKITLERVVRDV